MQDDSLILPVGIEQKLIIREKFSGYVNLLSEQWRARISSGLNEDINPDSTDRIGAAGKNAVCEELESKGYLVLQGSGGRPLVDVWVLKMCTRDLYLIRVKTTFNNVATDKLTSDEINGLYLLKEFIERHDSRDFLSVILYCVSVVFDENLANPSLIYERL